MDRRSFLKGTFGGVATGLIVAATPGEIEQFATGLMPGDALNVPSPILTGFYTPEMGDILFNHKGDPIAVVRRVTVEYDTMDASGYGDEFRQIHRGVPTVTITAVSSGITYIKARST